MDTLNPANFGTASVTPGAAIQIGSDGTGIMGGEPIGLRIEGVAPPPPPSTMSPATAMMIGAGIGVAVSAVVVGGVVWWGYRQAKKEMEREAVTKPRRPHVAPQPAAAAAE